MTCEPCKGAGCDLCDGVGVECPADLYLEALLDAKTYEDASTLFIAESEVDTLEGFQEPWKIDRDGWLRAFRQRWRADRGLRNLLYAYAIYRRRNLGTVPGKSKLLAALGRMVDSWEWRSDILPREFREFER